MGDGSMFPVYREYRPSPLLHPWVDCFWHRHVPVRDQHFHRVLPDGCIDILFELEGSFAGTGYVVGMMTRPLIIARSGVMHIFAIRFKPGAAAAFLREPLHRLTGTSVDLLNLWPRSRELPARVCAAATNEQRIDLLERELLTRLLPSRSALRCQALALSTLAQSPEFRIDELCRHLSITRQGLAKTFRTHVGISPKSLARILRMQTVLRQIDACDPHSIRWTDLALSAGYFDQSHMIREFHELSGLSPQALLHERRQPVSISPIQ